MALGLPDVLVLAGGGLVGEAWMTGVLSGIEETAGIDFRNCESFVGTSAGSIVGAHLAAGRRPRRPSFPVADLPDEPPEMDGAEARALTAVLVGGARRSLAGASRVAEATLAPLASTALIRAAPGGSLARAALLSRLPNTGERLDRLRANIDALGARFDGRLRVTAVDRIRGRRVVFGA